MRTRNVGVALATAAVMVLAACGSSGETGSPSALPGGASSGSTPSASADGGVSGSASGASGSNAGSAGSQVGSTGASGGDAGSSDAGSNDEVSAENSAPTTSHASTTLSGEMDSATKNWFSAMCTGMTPMLSLMGDLIGSGMAGMMGGATSGQAPDYAALKKKMVDAMSKSGKAMTDTAKTLGSLPPPDIDQGDKIAPALVSKYQEAGAKLTSAAGKLAKADVHDAASFSAAMSQLQGLEGVFTDAGSDVLSNSELSPKLQAEMMKLPACEPMAKMQSSMQAAIPTGLVPTTN